jgi:hypothetical protein
MLEKMLVVWWRSSITGKKGKLKKGRIRRMEEWV